MPERKGAPHFAKIAFLEMEYNVDLTSKKKQYVTLKKHYILGTNIVCPCRNGAIVVEDLMDENGELCKVVKAHCLSADDEPFLLEGGEAQCYQHNETHYSNASLKNYLKGV